ncbi:MAG: hypothetical protein LBI17_00295, partial [Rickettsiales bacterium]|nr:hypothetical protein [Rickettsiales bacterium]
KQRDEELNRTIAEKIKTADLSNPEEIAAITQLMRMTSNSEGLKELNSISTTANAKRETPIEEKYAIKSIAGAGGNLVANVENIEKKTSIRLRVGSELDGWAVDSIKNSSILFKKDGSSKIMYINQ